MEIDEQFKRFHNRFAYMQIDTLVEYFALFGGVEEYVEFGFFESIEESIERICIKEYEDTKRLIESDYILQEPYRKLSIAIARSDGKILNIFKRARVSQSIGGAMIDNLVKDGIVSLKQSRERPISRELKPILPKELRRYRIQPKVHFIYPFYRFWFGFIEPFRAEILKGKSKRVLENYQAHRERVESFLFERLSNAMLERYMSSLNDECISSGNLWDRISEFDIFSITKSGKIILGECKFKSRKVSAGELYKLKEKAKNSQINPDIYALFSFEGFSNELIDRAKSDKSLLLFDKEDLNSLII